MKKIFLFILPIFLFIFSCSLNVDDEGRRTVVENNVSNWTVLIYMAADNSLEASAISDFNELEEVNIPENINVLVLLDRSEFFDASNDDWSDTRLFKVVYDKYHSNKIVSKRLSSYELGLSLDKETELDMSNKDTLSNALRFSKTSFPAEKYALIVWGHGTGWRNISSSQIEQSTRAFAIDEGGNDTSYMTISSMRQSIENVADSFKLDFLGFDTCFGTCLESAYEFRNIARIMCGSPNIESGDGWDYKSLFSLFSKTSFTEIDFAESVLQQFKNQYENYLGGAFCVLNLEKCENAIKSFNEFSLDCANMIQSYEQRDSFIDIFQNRATSYKATSFPSDFYVDSYSLVENIGNEFPELKSNSKKVLSNFDSFVIASWSSLTKKCSPGVFYNIYKSDGVFSASHPQTYINGNNSPEVSQFVVDCTGYVPTLSKSNSLLDKVFYTFFE